MKLREMRYRAGYTQKDFAKLLDVHPAYLSIIENGHRRVSAKVRRKASEILGCKPTEIE